MDTPRDGVDGEPRQWLITALLGLSVAALLAPFLGGPGWLNRAWWYLAGFDFFCVKFEDHAGAEDEKRN